jgi:hypothetical protein
LKYQTKDLVFALTSRAAREVITQITLVTKVMIKVIQKDMPAVVIGMMTINFILIVLLARKIDFVLKFKQM